MAFEIPSARIRQLQADLRREAGVPAYDPADPSIPQLPSIADAVAALDPDLPPSLRCDRCSGALPRGLQSTICIYCGADRGKGGLSHSISFNSTIACRKLLDFLGLDGSEAVLLDTESSGSNKQQETPKGELVLSDLLDLELRWPSDKEDVDNNTTITMPSPNTYALSLPGVDLDNFFSERKQETPAITPEPIEEFMPRQTKDTNIPVSSGSENFAELEKLQATDTKTSSFSSNFGESFSVWNAEFQPASTNTSVSPKSLDLFQDSSVHGLAHAPKTESAADQLENIEVVGGIGNESDPPSMVNKQPQDDFWPMESVKIDASHPHKSDTYDDTMSVLNSTSSRGITEFDVPDNIWLTSSTKESENSSHINPNDDPFDLWQDFTSSIEKQKSLSNQGPETGLTLFDHSSETKLANLFSESNKNELGEHKSLDTKNDYTDDWQDFTSSGQQGSSLSYGTQSSAAFFDHPLEMKSVDPLQMSSKEGSDSLDTMDNIHDSSDAWQNFAGSGETMKYSINKGASSKDSLGSNAVDSWPVDKTKDLDKNNSLHGDDDSFDDWQDFTSFSNGPERSSNLGIPSGSTLFEQPSETKSVDTWPTKEQIESTNGHDDTFDDWQDFTSSIQVQQSSSSPGEQSKDSMSGHLSETNLVHQQGIKTDAFSQAWEDQKDYPGEKDIQLTSLSSDRTKEVDHETAMDPYSMMWDIKATSESSNANANSKSEKSDVEKLTSQMPDLSFMLAEELSVPEKHT
ncbi:hypothetical protein Cni_G22641 [Canna indica]|uniref:DUF7815 domain-containing protein n=1 Tax=Canna indica TaxID=4628 RepID=A0AAQ3QLT0_9LILI|nr:hypothetical protein Cni_G22641 [Canna indica]